ncbi:MAG: response regulator [Ectothiorhodospiraceae bacterium]|nr:response regulator [Ectothiorhodospiraceae bacterium]
MNGPSSPMIAEQISVVIVDDAKVTLEILRRALRQTGYEDIRIASSGEQALSMMRERRANLLLADWLMPGIDGLELTRQVRQLDEETNHYTYVLLLTAREGADSLAIAFANGVDDFINKSPDNTELLLRIHAAGRISTLQNELLKANQRLHELNMQMNAQHSFDVRTGLGNRRYVEDAMERLLRHVEARGGIACVALVGIHGRDSLARIHGDTIANELLGTVATRLRQSVRPLDVVGTVAEGEFAILLHHENPDQFHSNAFRRIFQALNLRAYKTSAGFVNAQCAIAMCGLNRAAAEQKPAPGKVLEFLQQPLKDAENVGRVHLCKWADSTVVED